MYSTGHRLPVAGNQLITLSYKSELDEIIDRIVAQLHNGAIKPGDVDPALWELVSAQLYKGVESGYGATLESGKASQVNMLKNLRSNVYVFSGFKNYQFLRQATDLLIDGDGKVKGFDKFRQDILSLNDEYNVNYLSAEYNHAVASSQMASKWQQFKEDQGALPLLQYITAGDARVRQSHQPLDNIIKPVDDPFWDIYMPPNDWNCRCSVKQLADGEISKTVSDQLPQLKDSFKSNPGKDGVIFPESHPYFKVKPEDQANADDNFGLNIPE